MDHKRERAPEYSVTFLNKKSLDESTIESMFNEFGPVTYIHEKNNRYFIKYKDRRFAEEAIEKYGRELGVDFARERNRDSQPQDKDRDRDRDRDRQFQDRDRNRQPQDRDRNQDFNAPRNFDDDKRSNANSQPSLLGAHPSEVAYGEQNQRSKLAMPSPPDLIDGSTEMPVKYLFIIGNFPRKFTQEDIRILIEETKPSHIGKIDFTPELELPFCPIHLDSLEKVQYLHNKLDGFVVAGNQLVAMEAGQLIEEGQLV